jgi:DNA-binding NtrC family response regulator
MKQQIDKLATIPSPVLILGESGSGKELVARRLHDAGPRCGRTFVAINCAALPEAMVESELFGHERGAFTGADRTRKGAFESAHGGTLFLDEIGELPAPAQAKLLRVLEDAVITRLGSHSGIKVDARVVAATNRELDAAVAGGTFRQDLLFRLNTHVVQVPPLRERLSDVPLLAASFLQLVCEKFGVRPRRFDPATVKRLQSHAWTRNNVRELRNVIEQLVIAGDDEVITPDLLPAGIGSDAGGAVPTATALAGGPLKDQKVAAERQIILTALERNDWHITNTAAQLGLADHSSLLKIMRRHGLKK